MRIVLVEDSPRVVAVLSTVLRGAAHSVSVAGSSAEAHAIVDAAHFDLGIVDIGLPDGSGIELCRRLRADGYTFPILLLTARNEVNDRVTGLDAGADDYLGKPFANAELLARVRALGRRGPRWTETSRTFGSITIDRARCSVLWGERALPMTARELEIVALLAWAEGRVIPKDSLLESLWGEATEGAASSLEVLLTRIRRKLTTAGAPNAIKTIRNRGYAWALERSKSG